MTNEDKIRKMIAQALALLEKADEAISEAADDAEWAEDDGYEFVAAQGDLSEAINACNSFANAVE
jgi:hypothetical protein